MRAPLETRPIAIVLGFLAFLFLLRVLCQMLVALAGVSWLPPMPEWYSGLLPYPLLLPAQLVILLVQGKMIADFWWGTGGFVAPRRRLGVAVCWFSAVYFGAMVLRYVITMSRHPERRWFGTGTIPIVFHWVLAAYLMVFGRYHLRAAGARA